VKSQRNRWLAAALVLLLGLALWPSPALAAGQDARRAPGFSQVWDLFLSVWALRLPGFHPSSQPSPGTKSGDEGVIMDPDGTPAPGEGDAGMGMDPDGAPVPGEGDAGVIMDPDGAP